MEFSIFVQKRLRDCVQKGSGKRALFLSALLKGSCAVFEPARSITGLWAVLKGSCAVFEPARSITGYSSAHEYGVLGLCDGRAMVLLKQQWSQVAVVALLHSAHSVTGSDRTI